jgi:hypothetical protein
VAYPSNASEEISIRALVYFYSRMGN